MKKIIAQTFVSLSLLATHAAVALAQSRAPAAPVGGSFGTTVDPSVTPFTNFGKLVSNIVQVLMFVAGLFFFLYLVLGGIQWILSGGDKAAAQAARDRITNAFIGLVIVVGAFAITLIIERVFGIPILSGFNFKPAERSVG